MVIKDASETIGDATMFKTDQIKNTSPNRRLLFRPQLFLHKYLLLTSLLIHSVMYALTQLVREKDTIMKSFKLLDSSKNPDTMCNRNALTKLRHSILLETELLISMNAKDNMMSMLVIATLSMLTTYCNLKTSTVDA